MPNESQVEYHLRELQAALDPNSPAHALPAFRDTDRSILDIGCGIGQSLVAAGDAQGRMRVGIDVDAQSLAYGHRHYPQICHVRASAEALPFRDGVFDLVMSRVALPYTDLRASLPEIARVSTSGGRIWLSLHSCRSVVRHLLRSAKTGAWKDVLFRLYVLANGLFLHVLGTQFRFPLGRRCESFQTSRQMRRDLGRLGVEEINIQRDQHFICSARKR